jgi:hypothetical protein
MDLYSFDKVIILVVFSVCLTFAICSFVFFLGLNVHLFICCVNVWALQIRQSCRMWKMLLM